MTRRERLENKVARRETWAASAEQKSAARFAGAHRIANNIPFGQPILVGHHSERHARADQRRIQSGMDKGVELMRLAKHHESKAAGLSDQLENCIFSDDTDATDALRERLAAKIAKRDHMKKVNALYRKGDAAGLSALGLDLETLRARVAAVGYSWVKAPFESYQLSNLGASIKTDERRIKDIEGRNARTEQANAAGGVLIEARENWSGYCRVTFAEKPERDILNALRDAGFTWGGGHWSGKASDLPECVKAEGVTA